MLLRCYLDRLARKSRYLHRSIRDEPAVCKMLYDFSRTLGLRLSHWEGKNNLINYYLRLICAEKRQKERE